MSEVTLQRVEKEVAALQDSFVNLVQAAQFADEAADDRKQGARAPAGLAEVLAERVTAAAGALLDTIALLKRGAVGANYAALNRHVAQRSAQHSAVAAAAEATLAQAEEAAATAAMPAGVAAEAACGVPEDMQLLHRLALNVPPHL